MEVNVWHGLCCRCAGGLERDVEGTVRGRDPWVRSGPVYLVRSNVVLPLGGLPPIEDSINDVGGHEPGFETEVSRQFIAKEPGDLIAAVPAKQMRNQGIADAVVLVYGTGVIAIALGIKHSDRVPLVQQRAQFPLRPPSPGCVVFHLVRLRGDPTAHAGSRLRH